MSLPGDRDAQRMLLGEEPLSKGRPLRALGSSAGRERRSAPKRSESLPGTSDQKHLERKADPGIGLCLCCLALMAMSPVQDCSQRWSGPFLLVHVHHEANLLISAGALCMSLGCNVCTVSPSCSASHV